MSVAAASSTATFAASSLTNRSQPKQTSGSATETLGQAEETKAPEKAQDEAEKKDSDQGLSIKV